MATIDLGKVAFVWKGTYNSGTTYEEKDVVQYTDSGELSSYIYVNASSASGQTPSTGGTVNTTYWSKMAGGTTLSVGNNKIVTTDASGNVSSVAIGSANQVLKTNSSANGFEFGSGSKVLGMKSLYNSGNVTVSSDGSGSTHDHGNIMGGTLSYTPQSTSSKILVSLTSGIGGFQDKGTGGFGLSLSVAQSGGINYSNHHASEYGFYDLSTTGMSYGDSSCISRMDSNSSTNAITVTGQGYWYDETPNGSAQFRKPCLTIFEFEE